MNNLEWDHPRSRGEYPPRLVTSIHAGGSSPLSRGIRHPTLRPRTPLGIIPALAGNTLVRTCDLPLPRDHPRSRGEYRPPLPDGGVEQGSSPLSRGILRAAIVEREIQRIIPALAGNTERLQHVGGSPQDHPRSRGEYLLAALVDQVKGGSSPLSRGIRLIRECFWIRRQDHPRSRGEYLKVLFRVWDWEGSSPLSRGIPECPGAGVLGRRIIPALAGNTPAGECRWRRGRDHPRSRGEYGQHELQFATPDGSSPLSRGIQFLGGGCVLLGRIIPALAGNTQIVHP